MSSRIVKFNGIIQRQIYYKDDWGIILVQVESIETKNCGLFVDELVTVKGNMPKPKTGKIVTVKAQEVFDSKYGKQYDLFYIHSGVDIYDPSPGEKRVFLESLFTEKQINSMYNRFDDPFTILKEEKAEKLVQIKGCGAITAGKWIATFRDNVFKIQILTELDEYNLTMKMVDRLIETYGSPELVVQKVKTNPYVLCDEVEGIGCARADKIALDGGIEFDSPLRIGGFVRYYLKQCGDSGRSYISGDELLGAILDNLGEEVPDEAITEGLRSVKDMLWVNEDQTQFGLIYYYNLESKIAEQLIRLKNASPKVKFPDNWEEKLKELERGQGWEFTKEQREGIKLALDNNITVIQGSAGTGKSTLVSAFLHILHRNSYVQCALSGRASSRMAEITGKEGYTIHRLLGFPKGPEEFGKFYYHEENKYQCDIFILDEISMVDGSLFLRLLKAIPSGSKLICLGDPGQLEAIGSCNIAFDMVHSDVIPTVTLTKIHRQAAKSAIITESTKVRQGQQLIEKDWAGSEVRGELQDLRIECYSDPSNSYYKVMSAFNKAMSDEHFDILETQIIVPLKYRGDICTYQLNNVVQELYNPSDSSQSEVEIRKAEHPYILREGDKVLNTKNNYKTEPPIYNGNIGYIKKIDLETEEMIIYFIGIGDVVVEKQFWSGIELGYAMTVHKSQGSQMDHVIFGLDQSGYILATRELLYTGLTRAKEKCELIAQNSTLRSAVFREFVSKKTTHLQRCLKEQSKIVF